MAITDLTNTTWNVPSGWTATAGCGQFSIDGAVNDFTFDEFCIGYEILFIDTIDYLSAADKISVNLGPAPVATFSPTQQLTLSFTEGTDTTNTDLISWLAQNGELQTEEEATDTVTITYGERTITLTAGQKCTFKGGKVMQADIVAVVSGGEDSIIGTWVLNEAFDIQEFIDSGSWGDISTLEIQYISNGVTYDAINTSFTSDVDMDTMEVIYTGNLYYCISEGTNAYTTTLVYSHSKGWVDTAYRTINIVDDSGATDEFITWLKANATKQGEVTLISFTIDGVSYQAEEGMTWGEWGDSEYDPSGHWFGGYFDGYYLCKSGSSIAETSADVIVDGQAYVLNKTAGGGAD